MSLASKQVLPPGRGCALPVMVATLSLTTVGTIGNMDQAQSVGRRRERTDGMRTLLTVGTLAITTGIFANLAIAGPNAGGVLVVHAGEDIVYTTDHNGYCEVPGFPGECSDLDTNLPADVTRAQVWWVVACFPPESQPRVKGVEFGVQYNQQELGIVDWGDCDEFSIQSTNWPAPGTGVAIVFGQTHTESVFPLYWFAGYAYLEGDFGFSLRGYPGHGGNFGDDSPEPVLDPVADYGVLGFGDHAGYLPCPGSPGACCLPDGACVSVEHAGCEGTWLGSSIACEDSPCARGACCLPSGVCTLDDEAACGEQGGVFRGPLTACEPQLCAAEVGACCLPGDQCAVLSEVECDALGGELVWPGTVCDPMPCRLSGYDLTADGGGQLPTIQAAINAAGDGAEIRLADGIYRGFGNHDLDFGGKSLTVRSGSGDPGSCVIDCESRGRGFFFGSGQGSESLVEGLTITRGLASEGGAVFVHSGSPKFTNCRLVENRAVNGGAVRSHGSSARFEQCAFVSNEAEAGGGALDLAFGGAVEAVSCRFEGNQVPGTRGVGGAIAAYLNATIRVEDCLFVDCYASEGGALWSLSTPGSRVTSTTFARNEARIGSAVYSTSGNGGPLVLERSILAFGVGGEALYCAAAPVELSCVDIFGNEGGDYVGCIADQNGIRGNRSVDPKFCDLVGGDYRLKPGSPCLPPLGGTVTSCPILGSEGRDCGALAPGAMALRSEPLAGDAQRHLVLGSVVPNPSLGEIEFSLEMAQAGRLRVELVDVTGRAVHVLVDDLVAAGSHRIQSLAQGGGGRPLPAGVYYLRASDGRSIQQQKLVLVR